MNIADNSNFISVEKYNRVIDIEVIRHTGMSYHMQDDRIARLHRVMKYDKDAQIDAVFVVDKGHYNGKELHCISTNGIIYVLNKAKYESGYIRALVTVMFGRPNQIARLYEHVGMKVKYSIIQNAMDNCNKGLNRMV